MAGRHSKLTPAVEKKIVDAIAAGNFAQVAAAYAGISVASYFGWLARGKAARELDECPESERRFVEFLEAVEAAEAKAEVSAVVHLRKHFGKDRAAVVDFLKRRFRDRWGDFRVVAGDPDRPLEHAHRNRDLTREELIEEAKARGLPTEIFDRPDEDDDDGDE